MPRQVEPISGSSPDNLKPVRVNNRVRRAIDAAIGSLTLLSSDPAKRLEAARAVFKSRDAGALKTLDAAINKETESRVKRALIEARAAATIYSPDASTSAKIDAIAIIRERGDQDARGLAGRHTRIARERKSNTLRPMRCRPSTPILRCGARCRTPGTVSRSARCFSLPRSASPSPSA